MYHRVYGVDIVYNMGWTGVVMAGLAVVGGEYHLNSPSLYTIIHIQYMAHVFNFYLSPITLYIEVKLPFIKGRFVAIKLHK